MTDIHSASAHNTKFFFEKAYPQPTGKNFQTQLGVHFEEVSEFIDSMHGIDPMSEYIRDMVSKALAGLSTALKQGNVHFVVNNRVEFLDGLCDQMVTAVGVGHMAHMNIGDAFAEVNESNLSKFDDDGKPILDENLKLMKGPNYFKPNLEPFV